MNKYQILIIIFSVIFVTNANAKCLSDGKPVPTGTKRGEYTCCSDGTWKIRCT